MTQEFNWLAVIGKLLAVLMLVLLAMTVGNVKHPHTRRRRY